ncbi:6080_t:CDS:2 [Funneliformis geosporum]|nr:6080_t:CDS:2 [Funneliformis geosporum]
MLISEPMVLQNNGVAHGGNLRTNAAAAATANNTAIVADKLYIIQNVTTGVGNENGIDPTNPNNVAGGEADDIGFGLGHTGGAIGGNNSRNIPVGERTRTTRSFLEKYHELRKSATDVGSNNSAITPATGAAGAGPAADGKPGQGAINSYTGQEAAQILAHVFNNNWLANDLSLENNDITVKKAPDGTKISHSRKLSANANAAGNKFTLLLNNAYSKDDKNNAWGSGGDPVITNSLIDRIFGSARMTINGEPEKSYNNRLESLKLLRLARKALGLTSYTSEANVGRDLDKQVEESKKDINLDTATAADLPKIKEKIAKLEEFRNNTSGFLGQQGKAFEENAAAKDKNKVTTALKDLEKDYPEIKDTKSMEEAVAKIKSIEKLEKFSGSFNTKIILALGAIAYFVFMKKPAEKEAEEEE